MVLLFLLATGFCVYTYVVFPLLLHIRTRSIAESEPQAPQTWPDVSIIIAAHNEEQHIEKKVATLSKLDYPADKLQIIFVSDGSTDKTVELLKQASTENFPISVVSYDKPAGKPSALNVGVEHAQGEVLVFMDARQDVSSNCVKVLVSHLMQHDVGVVSGELELVDDDGFESANVGLYWRYEKWIRQNESRLFSTTGATGALYAIAHRDYMPHKQDVLLDDFDTPVLILSQGRRTVLASNALVYDKTEADVSGEFKRKVRTLTGNFQSFKRHDWLLKPASNPVFWQFVSHKVFRLFVPYALLIAFLSALFGSGMFLNIMLLAQLLFYGLGLLGLLGVKGMNNRYVNFIKVFLKLNAAAVVGAFRFYGGRTQVMWKQS